MGSNKEKKKGWTIKDRPDPFRLFLMGGYMNRAMDVLDFYEYSARTVRIPLLGPYFFRPIINLYGAKYHSGRAMPLRDIVHLVQDAKTLVVSECACRVRMNLCDHSTRTCLKLNSGAETELEKGDLKSEKIDTEEAVKIVTDAFDAGLMLQVEWCIDPFTYSICCCCPCCCSQRRLRFEYGIKSGVMNSEYLPEFDMDACTDCGRCEELCPGSAISVKDGLRIVDEQNCVGCGLCEHHCPAGAVNLVTAREPAVAKDYNIFHYFLIYISCFFVLIPYFLIFLMLKGGRRERARDVEW